MTVDVGDCVNVCNRWVSGFAGMQVYNIHSIFVLCVCASLNYNYHRMPEVEVVCLCSHRFVTALPLTRAWANSITVQTILMVEIATFDTEHKMLNCMSAIGIYPCMHVIT